MHSDFKGNFRSEAAGFQRLLSQDVGFGMCGSIARLAVCRRRSVDG